MRSNEDHLKRARNRINALHGVIDAIEAELQKLRAKAVKAEGTLQEAVKGLVEAKTAAAIAQLERKE